MKQGNLQSRIIFSSLTMSFAANFVLAGIMVASILGIRSFVLKRTTVMGEIAKDIGVASVESYLQDSLLQTAKDTAKILDEKLLHLENFTRMVSGHASNIYDHSGDYRPRILPYTAPAAGPPAMQEAGAVIFQTAPGVSLGSVAPEAHLVANVVDTLGRLADINADIASAFIAGESGYIISVNSVTAAVGAYDPQKRPWFIGAKETRNVFWTDVYVDARGKGLVVACSAPVFAQGGAAFKGVAAACAQMSSFDRIIEEANVVTGHSNYVFILKRKGEKLFASNGTGAKIAADGSIVVENYLLADNKPRQSIARQMTNGDTGVMRTKLFGEECYVVYTPLSTVDWSVGLVFGAASIAVPIDGLKADVDKLVWDTESWTNRVIAALLAAIVIGSAGLLIFITFSVTKDVRQFAKYTAEQERIGAELNLARGIQERMMSRNFPASDDFTLFAEMLAAKEVGGDFYDFFPIAADGDGEKMALVIADVSGKGIAAAMFLVVVKLLLKLELQSGASPEIVADRVNRRLCQNNDALLFVTVWFGVYHPKTGTIDYVNAGHNPPLLRQSGGGFRYLQDDDPCMVMGMLDEASYHPRTLRLQKNDMLLLYTDGFTEAENAAGEEYGEGRFLAALNRGSAHLDPQSVLRGIKADLASFVGAAKQKDDQTCLMVIQNADAGNRIVLPADRSAFPQLKAYMHSLLDSIPGCSAEGRSKMLTAAEELFINIADYAYRGGAGELVISYTVEDDTVLVTFADQGVAFNPLELPPPNIEMDLDYRQEGGFGVFMVRQLMDVVEYRRESGWNRMTIGKKLLVEKEAA